MIPVPFTIFSGNGRPASPGIYFRTTCSRISVLASGCSIIAAAPVPGFGFTAPLPPEAADHVAAVAVFGNPSSKIGQPLTNSPSYGFKTIDLCNDGDPICSPGRLFSAHSGYTPGMTNQAASFVAGLL